MGSSHRPLQRIAAAGYQEAEIPKRLPYLNRLSSPLACCPCGTAHAPFGLHTIAGFRHIPKGTLKVPRTTLSYPAIRSACADRTDRASSPLRSCHLAMTSAAQ